MRNTQSTEGATPGWLLVCLVAGITSGLVTGLGLFLALGPTSPARQDPAPMLSPEGGMAVEGMDEWLDAIRTLTESVDRMALGAPRPTSAARTEIKGGASDVMAQLSETLTLLNEKLDRLATRPSGRGGIGAPLIRESLRLQPVRATEVAEVISSLQGVDGESFKRSLYLRSIEEMVKRFGVPSSVSAASGYIQAKWRSGEQELLIRFIDGVVAFAHG